MKDFNPILTAYMHNMFPRGGQEKDILSLYKDLPDKEINDSKGKNLYHLAARFFDAEAIEYLSSQDIKPRADEAGNTPLHDLVDSPYTNDIRNLARKADDIYRSVKRLIELKVNPKKKNDEGQIAYIKAGIGMMYPFIQALADCGVRMDAVAKENKNLLHLIVEQASYRKNNPDTIEAARKTIKILLETESIDPGDQDIFGTTPLTYAQRAGLKEIAALLNGTEDDLQTAGMTLEQAVLNKDAEAVEALSDNGADVNEVTESLRTPLMRACEYPSLEIAKLLIKKGADVNYKTGENGHTAVYYLLTAAVAHLGVGVAGGRQDPRELIRMLRTLADNGLDVNATIDNEGNTPLHVLCAAGYLAGLNNRLAEELIDAGCNVNQTNLAGQTPLMIFAARGNETEHNIAELLLDHEALTDAVDKFSNTALMYAAGNPDKASAQQIVRLLIDAGDDTVERVNNQGQTALDIAVEAGNEAVVKILLTKI